LRREEDKMEKYIVKTDLVRGKYLEVSDDKEGILITAYNHKGEIEEVINEDTIKNFKVRK